MSLDWGYNWKANCVWCCEQHNQGQPCCDMLACRWVTRNTKHIAQKQVLSPSLLKLKKYLRKITLCKRLLGRQCCSWGFEKLLFWTLQKNCFSVNRSKGSHKKCVCKVSQRELATACASIACVGRACRCREFWGMEVTTSCLLDLLLLCAIFC